MTFHALLLHNIHTHVNQISSICQKLYRIYTQFNYLNRDTLLYILFVVNVVLLPVLRALKRTKAEAKRKGKTTISSVLRCMSLQHRLIPTRGASIYFIFHLDHIYIIFDITRLFRIVAVGCSHCFYAISERCTNKT